jgi:hypothetical protein
LLKKDEEQEEQFLFLNKGRLTEIEKKPLLFPIQVQRVQMQQTFFYFLNYLTQLLEVYW